MSNRTSSKTRLRSTKGKGEKKDIEEEKSSLPQLAWKIINQSSMKELKLIEDVDEIANKLSEILLLEDHKTSLKEAAQLDYFVAGYWFASRESKFTTEQTSAFITILHTLLDNLKSKHVSLRENVKELQAMLSGVACPGVQNALECFTPEVSTAALVYVKSTLFQHYSLFNFLFTEDQEEEIISGKVNVELPNADDSMVQLFPFPLEESIPLELHQRCLAPKSASPVPVPQSDSCPPCLTGEVSASSVIETAASVEVEAKDSTDEDKESKEEEEVVKEQLQMSIVDVKSIMETMATAALQSFQFKMMHALKVKEKELGQKLSKLEKLLDI